MTYSMSNANIIRIFMLNYSETKIYQTTKLRKIIIEYFLKITLLFHSEETEIVKTTHLMR